MFTSVKIQNHIIVLPIDNKVGTHDSSLLAIFMLSFPSAISKRLALWMGNVAALHILKNIKSDFRFFSIGFDSCFVCSIYGLDLRCLIGKPIL